MFLTIRKLNPEVVEFQVNECVAELFTPELLFVEDIQAFAAL